MSGGAGNDTYVVDNAGDTVTELSGEGTDLVQSSVSYTLGANVDNLTLTGSANIDGTGNGDVNAIIGNSGNNTLDGGAGADTMTGGAGNDTYVVDDVGDVVVEGASEGIDTVQTSVSYTLTANVENLILTGNGNISANGNGFANSITGNSGDNTLDGGAGPVTMTGGLGNDTYVVDNVGDVVVELPPGHGYRAVLVQLHARGQCREPDPDGRAGDRRHRRRRRQLHHRQQRRQYPERSRRRRRAGRRLRR